jgi:hypothetical protein
MPRGSYRVLADLPPEFELGQMILHGPPPPVEVERGACLEQEIVAVPSGRISGIVFGPDGTPRNGTTVRLFKADEYRREARGPYALQIDGKPFTFDRLLPADYLVVFHAEEDANSNNPFPTTFHSNASDVRDATVIHLGAGQRVSTANIHLTTASPTRKLRITLEWNGHNRSLYNKPLLFRPGGALSDASYLADDSLEIELVTSAIYSIRAYAGCRSSLMSLLETDSVDINSDADIQPRRMSERSSQVSACPAKAGRHVPGPPEGGHYVRRDSGRRATDFRPWSRYRLSVICQSDL